MTLPIAPHAHVGKSSSSKAGPERGWLQDGTKQSLKGSSPRPAGFELLIPPCDLSAKVRFTKMKCCNVPCQVSIWKSLRIYPQAFHCCLPRAKGAHLTAISEPSRQRSTQMPLNECSGSWAFIALERQRGLLKWSKGRQTARMASMRWIALAII